MAAMTPSAAASAAQKLHAIKGGRHLFSSSDDSIIMKQIQQTHSPEGRDFDVRAVLYVVEQVLLRANPAFVLTAATPKNLLEPAQEAAQHAGLILTLEAIAYTVHRISYEVTFKCSGAVDAHSTTMAVFHTLSTYTWDAKAVMALAAMAVNYGEFWLTTQLHSVNPLAKSVALLKQIPDIIEHTDVLKARFDAINNLIRVMLDITKSIVEFTELPTDYISLDSPDMITAMTHIPTAVYWVVRGIVACISQTVGLIGIGHEYISSTTEVWELSTIAHKLANIHDHLSKQLELCNKYIDGKRHHEAYQTLIRLFETIHIDNMKILRALIYSKDELPLFDCLTKKRVGVDVLRRKIVMLFISDLEVSNEELFILIQIYQDIHHGRTERNYEVLWLPVTDRYHPWSENREEDFKRLAFNMTWYILHHPSLLQPAAIKYMREIWHFDKKPILVVLDAQGRVVCPNALHMIWIWGSLAFPFTSSREEALWKEESWRVEFLIDEIDQTILSWIGEGKHICLYGGEDIDWIRKFTKLIRKVAHDAGVPLEMVYVGKSSQKGVKKATEVIKREELSGHWEDPAMVWFFWARLESMWHSKMQHGGNVEQDQIMQEVMQLLSFGGGDEGWAIISHGSFGMVKSHGKKLYECLMEFESWKESVEEEGFVSALTKALLPYQTHEHCTRLILPGETGGVQERIICVECKRPMEKYVLYRCCKD
ncbi:protein SIEVE ELEMENT OCCLUSION B-like [Phalaenopsis equestris]|uniref:protein SIEVE ELEMENT OCCLUSION B-like n=1 Tax=Phalaenopsis equestris TaxID=78828 RepID=UPI0009E5777A|nr:protein SIEVE ELEMENT OCCLUSION B-like [Phalaenopsis equestris]